MDYQLKYYQGPGKYTKDNFHFRYLKKLAQVALD